MPDLTWDDVAPAQAEEKPKALSWDDVSGPVGEPVLSGADVLRGERLRRDLLDSIVPYDSRMYDAGDQKAIDATLVGLAVQRVPKVLSSYFGVEGRDPTPQEAAAALSMDLRSKAGETEAVAKGMPVATAVASLASRGARGASAGLVDPMADTGDVDTKEAIAYREANAPWLRRTGDVVETVAAIPTMKALGGATVGMGRYAAVQALASDKNPGLAGAEAAAFGWLGTRLSSHALKWLHTIPAVERSKALSKVSQVIAGMGGFDAADIAFHGQNADLLLSSVLGGAFALPGKSPVAQAEARMGTGRLHGPKPYSSISPVPPERTISPEPSGTPLVTAPRWESMTSAQRQAALAGQEIPSFIPMPEGRPALPEGRLSALPPGVEVKERTLLHDFTPSEAKVGPGIPVPYTGPTPGQEPLVPQPRGMNVRRSSAGERKLLPETTGGPLAPPPPFPDVLRPGDMPQDVARRAGVRAPRYGERGSVSLPSFDQVVDFLADEPKPLPIFEIAPPPGATANRPTAFGRPSAPGRPQERGAISMDKPIDIASGISAETKAFLQNDTTSNLWDAAPKTADAISRTSNAREVGGSQAWISTKEVRGEASKKDWERFQLSALADEIAETGEELRGKNKKDFDRAFPLGMDQARQWSMTPIAQELASRYASVHARDVEPMNVKAGATPRSKRPDALYRDVHLNLKPMTAEEAGVGGLGQKIGRNLVGPRTDVTPYAEHRTGKAEHGYQKDIRRQMGDALARAHTTIGNQEILSSMVEEGVAFKAGSKEAREKKGWEAFTPNATSEFGELVEGAGGEAPERAYMVHPEVARSLSSLYGRDLGGLGKFLGAAGTANRALSRVATLGIGEPLGHITGNLMQLHRVGLLRYAKNMAKYGLPTQASRQAFHEARLTLAKYGIANPVFERDTVLSKVIGGPGAHAIETANVAGKMAVLSDVAKEIASGRAPDSPRTYRDAGLKFGNYVSGTVVPGMKAIKAIPIGNIFATPGFTRLGSFFKQMAAASGFGEEGVLGIRTKGAESRAAGWSAQSAKLAATWGAYMIARGVINHAVTGDANPRGMPWYAIATNDHGGWTEIPAWMVGIAIPGKLTGSDRAVEHIREGKPAVEVASDVLLATPRAAWYAGTGGPLRRGFEKFERSKDAIKSFKEMGKEAAKGQTRVFESKKPLK